MRILIIGSHHAWRMEAAVARAARRAGHETLLVDDRRSKRLMGKSLTQRRVLLAARRFRPDFVFLSKCHALELDTVERVIRGLPNAMWYHDPQYHGDTARPDIAHITAVGRLADTFFITGFEDEWGAHGLNARFLPAAGAREIVPQPRDPGYAAEASFVGAGYDATRAEFLIALTERGVRVKVWGPRWEEWRDRLEWNGGTVEGKEFARVCSSADIVLGVNPARAAGATNYASDRIWMVILAGGFYLGPGTPGLDRMLLDGVHCAWYSGVESCAERARWFLAHEAERERIRTNGERFVREHHTYDARLPFLLAGERWENPL